MKRYYKTHVTEKLRAFLLQCQTVGRTEFLASEIRSLKVDTVHRRLTSYRLRPLRYESCGSRQRQWWSVSEVLEAVKAHEQKEEA